MVDIQSELQLFDESDGKAWIGPIILPGEEASNSTSAAREQVFNLLLRASAVVIVGYSFGLGSVPEYDRVWRELFVEAMRSNACPVHVINPHALDLCGSLAEEINRPMTLFPWPLRWDHFAKAFLEVGGTVRARDVRQLIKHSEALSQHYDEIANSSA